jgi:RNA-directed DNA polymerase
MKSSEIKGFFDNLNHALYTERWLKAPAQLWDGTLVDRSKGAPQGGVVSPLLANLFLHYAFDKWMRRNQPYIPFERYADDIIVHCKSEKQLSGCEPP